MRLSGIGVHPPPAHSDGWTDALFVPPVPDRPPAPLGALETVAALRRNALRVWTAEAYEADVVVRRFLGRRSVLLNAPDGIRRVLVEDHARFGRTRATERVLRPVLGDGLFLSEGEAWRGQRRALAPAFSPRAVALLARHMAEAADEAFGAWPRQSEVDLLGLFQSLTLDIAGRSMFSLQTGRHGPLLRELVDSYGAGLGRPFLLDFVLPRWVPSPQDLARRRFSRRWMGLLERILAERAASAGGDLPRDLYDLLQEAGDGGPGGAPAGRELRDQFATFILAGHETTALALFWSAWLLARAPDWQEAVADEAASLSLSAQTAAGDLDRLAVARAVVQEAMRLYPPAFTIVREAREDTRIGDLALRKGTLVVISPWILHRHRRLWSAPDAFDPRRFLPPAPPVDRFAYLPFGAGPRVCIGAQFALAEAALVLARLVRDFRFDVPDGRAVLPVAVVTTRPDHAPVFRLLRR